MLPITDIEQCNRKPLPEIFDESLAGESLYVKSLGEQADVDDFLFKIELLNGRYHLSTSYYMGVDWVKEGQPIQVLPKIEGVDGPVDYMKMLTDALADPMCAKYLDGLLTIDFNAAPVAIPEADDMLSPFIVAQFILVLKNAVRKGLRRSYYFVTENLKAKVKGRILTTKNISLNLSKGDKTDNYCTYQQYGLDSQENRLLKRALVVSSSILTRYRGGMNVTPLKQTIAQISAYFREVSDDFDPAALNHPIGTNPIFRDYNRAIEFGKLIIRRSAYGLDRDAHGNHTTPPYWIDMSKLFELYLLRKLRFEYNAGEIVYHKRFGGREPDYLLKPEEGAPMVIDAKYKPRYHDGSVDIEDVRQVSAYARMRGVHAELDVDPRETIACLIIYAHPDCPDTIGGRIRAGGFSQLRDYIDIYKLGIALPLKA